MIKEDRKERHFWNKVKLRNWESELMKNIKMKAKYIKKDTGLIKIATEVNMEQIWPNDKEMTWIASAC